MKIKEIENKLDGIRSELWHKLHDMQEWGIKDTIMTKISEIKDELKKLN